MGAAPAWRQMSRTGDPAFSLGSAAGTSIAGGMDGLGRNRTMLRTTAIAVAITTAIGFAALGPNVAIARGGVLHSVGQGLGGFRGVVPVGAVRGCPPGAHFPPGRRRIAVLSRHVEYAGPTGIP